MWAGVFIAAAFCPALGLFINATTGEFPQKQQELFEGIVAVIAVVILTGWSLDAQSFAQRKGAAGGGGRSGVAEGRQ